MASFATKTVLLGGLSMLGSTLPQVFGANHFLAKGPPKAEEEAELEAKRKGILPVFASEKTKRAEEAEPKRQREDADKEKMHAKPNGKDKEKTKSLIQNASENIEESGKEDTDDSSGNEEEAALEWQRFCEEQYLEDEAEFKKLRGDGV